MLPSSLERFRPAFYIFLNVLIGTGIVFANKSVFKTFGFNFVVALTFIHASFTWAGLYGMGKMGFFIPKDLPHLKLVPLTLCFLGYVVLNNMSLQINTVGFYQIMKIATTPCVILVELILFTKVPSNRVLMAVIVVCIGIGLATVTDNVVVQNYSGLIVGVGATSVTAMFQVFVGSKQKELLANSSQLLNAYVPQAWFALLVLVPCIEPIGLADPSPGTLLGYHYTTAAVCAIVISAVCGVLVSITTFLVIGTTSSLTFNVVGHIKTILILSGGCIFFDDTMPWKKALGVALSMSGIGWYTFLVATGMPVPKPATVEMSKEEEVALLSVNLDQNPGSPVSSIINRSAGGAI
jgi:solute carrier family 35 protein E3